MKNVPILTLWNAYLLILSSSLDISLGLGFTFGLGVSKSPLGMRSTSLGVREQPKRDNSPSPWVQFIFPRKSLAEACEKSEHCSGSGTH